MALAFPLSIAAFWDLLPIEEISFDAPEQLEMSQTAGGEFLTADLAPMLWTGSVRLGDMGRIEVAVPEVLLDTLRPAGRSFYAYDKRRPGPLNDLSGAILGAATPTIHTLNVNNRDIRLQGLPAGYSLAAGDYLAFDYGSQPRRALHRVVSTVAITAGTGITPLFEVSPMIRPGALVGAAVTLMRASCKARLVPGSVNKGNTSKTVTSGMSFKFTQTLG